MPFIVVTDTRIYVYLGDRYSDHVNGLCGNYNGKSSDDLGHETSIESSLADSASKWATNPCCQEQEPIGKYVLDTCEVCFSKLPCSRLRGYIIQMVIFYTSVTPRLRPYWTNF